MGGMYKFECRGCGYSAWSSGQRYDYGMRCVRTTVHCRTCRELQDVEISQDPANFRPYGATVDLRCPDGDDHDVVQWLDPGPCPKCGETMERGNERMLWD